MAASPIAARYLRFAETEAQGRSPLYDRLIGLADRGGAWISNEGPQVLPTFAGGLPTDQNFMMRVNGRPTARTGPHGQSIRWLA